MTISSVNNICNDLQSASVLCFCLFMLDNFDRDTVTSIIQIPFRIPPREDDGLGLSVSIYRSRPDFVVPCLWKADLCTELLPSISVG